MQQYNRFLIPLLILFCVGMMAFLGYRINLSRNAQTLRPSTEQTSAPEATPTPSVSPVRYKDLIEVESPLPNAVVSLVQPSTTIEVKGKARGAWFFEASFPIELLSNTGELLATGVATADGEWMTSEYVPFRATLSFSSTYEKTGAIGVLVLKKDNPSGLTENDDAFVIPIQFVK